MRITIGGPMRPLGALGLVASLAAVALAELEPDPARFRIETQPRYVPLNPFASDDPSSPPRLLDRETGALADLPLPRGESLEYASCSPWSDEEGEFQVVGRTTRYSSGTGRLLPEAFGLVRYSWPSGRRLDLVNLEVVPTSRPSWLPGGPARLVYSGGDGALYRVEFPTREGSERFGDEPPRPVPLAWRCPKPGARMLIRDPTVSSDPRLRGRIVASLAILDETTSRRFQPARLYWLELDDAGESIVAAGPLTDPGAERPGATRGDERQPNLAVTPDGALALTYLRQVPSRTEWDLLLARVGPDSRTGAPRVDSSEARTLTHSHRMIGTSFSTDGRVVFAVFPDPARRAAFRVVRIATEGPAAPAPETTNLDAPGPRRG